MKFGISFTATFFNQAGALVLIYRDGSVQVNHGGTEMGQGLHTKIRQIAADSLGVPLESVRMMPTRTDKVPNTSATAASAGTDLNGAAVVDACRQLRAALAPVAAPLLRLRSRRRGLQRRTRLRRWLPDVHVTFAEVVEAAYRQRAAALRARLLPHARDPLRSEDRPRPAVPLLRLRRRGHGGRGRRLHRRVSPAAHRHPAGRRRFASRR